MEYPGNGFGVENSIVLGGLIGTTYPVEIPVVMCKLFGTLQKPSKDAPGTAGTTLATDSLGNLVLTDTWNGVTVKAGISVADASSGKIVTIDTVATTTNASGYFELFVIQGLAVTVTCQSFGKSVAVPTAGLTSIDLSTFF